MANNNVLTPNKGKGNTMAYNNTVATAKHNALRKVATVQAVKPTPCPTNSTGCMVTTYYSAKLGTCRVVARLLNAQGMVVAYRVMHNGMPYTVPAGNLGAIGTLFVPYAIVGRKPMW